MRELKILAVVVSLTLLTYYLVEPFAHSKMHPHVDAPNYNFPQADKVTDAENVEKAKVALEEAEKAGKEKAIKSAKTDLANAEKFEKDTNAFWASAKAAIADKGNVANGEVLVTSNCTACHSIESKGFPPVMDNASAAAAYGVVPPDLGTAGKLYTKDYLVGFIMNPARASKVTHKFVDGRVHPMPGFDWMQPQELADIVAYLESIAPKTMTDKEVFHNACQRCHSIKYGDMQKGTMQAFTPDANIKTYMGKVPPDLSQYIKSRGAKYIHEFVNDPQKHLEGTAMPRVGLTQASEKQVVGYLEKVGDSKKAQREELGPKFLIYLVIFAIFAWLWKSKQWREMH
ncbi:ubiquinol cytochrome c oxidoreductase, cytochrome c1 subunit [Arcobacter nitrofigilis DSM 7299]|uniref:Ubiquinol cytochrome c oxidoreductase, cytochrome c1 subunit n=1 Tax=Arcobacter nitrofigilis (strain ATCC 33309 / DSM 7299 / CCUG 15893 / LMG 7604 / NCTC 12251 / CI) TaxID=572480 RepID=D5UZD5_ARCNC|nr:c-type cytochrome [Arcobacter nitrofigilis]ADG92172.1 ubiquinol cytochrome c oxidoreductase, cytochrome c1 subunit [Arcobacter nitrofigilis DSM 7299]